MINITPKEIARITGGKLLSDQEDQPIGGISIDSRTLCAGDLFIAVKGNNFDGHDFIREALEKGASGLLVQDDIDPSIMKKASYVIKVDSTIEAMGKVASEFRTRIDIPVICITGTNGKTTVKDILSHILSSRYNVLSSKSSYNNIIGLSLTLFDLDKSHDVAVLELGTNHPGEMAKLADIASPNIAVVTNIGDGHLEAFIDREGVFLEKISLLDFLPESGMIFLNKDDCLLARTVACDITKKFFGTSPGSDFLISDLSRKDEGYEFLLNGVRFHIPLEGVHNVYNAAAAVAVAGYFDISGEDARRSIEKASLPKMRLERTNIEGITFINDSYNANPDSFECALEVLQNSSESSAKGVVAGDMLELGDKAEEFHRTIGKSIYDRGIDFLITLGEKAGSIADGATESGMPEARVLRADSHEDAAEMVRHVSGPGTVVLLKGSRASKMEEVLKCYTIFCTR